LKKKIDEVTYPPLPCSPFSLCVPCILPHACYKRNSYRYLAVMSSQGQKQRMAMKRSASYNGFSFGLPSKIDELTIDDSLLQPSLFLGGWNLPFHRRDLVRSPNHGVDCPISNGFPGGFEGLKKADVSLTELSDASNGSDSAWQEEFLRLRRQEMAFEKDKARLSEEVKALTLKLELEEDLRRNDKECMDILRGHISALEGKLQGSEKKIRELEHEKQRVELSEVSSALTTASTREYTLVKARLDASQATVQALEADLKMMKNERSKFESQRKESQDLVIKLEHQLGCANKELQRRENRINELVEERRSLEDYQIKSRSLQRKDQKSSYALQTQIVNLQEKFEISERANEELASEKVNLKDKVNQLENKIQELEGSYRLKLEKALERVKTIKEINYSIEEDNQLNSVSDNSQTSHTHFSAGKSNPTVKEGNDMSELKRLSSALLVELNKQLGENFSTGIDLEHLKSVLNKVVMQFASGTLEAPLGNKFLERPLKLGTVSKESPQERTIWEKAQQDVS